MRVRDLVAGRRFPGEGWALLALLLLLPATTDAYTLSAVTLTHSAQEAVLDITASEPVRYEISHPENPDWIALDLLDADRAIAPASYGSSGDVSWFSGVKASIWRDDPNSRIVRYTLKTFGPTHYAVSATGSHLRLKVTRDKPEDMAPATGDANPGSAPTAVNPAGGGDPMNLDVQGADIRTVLRSIAEFGKVNIVPDREVEGAVNLRMVEVPWREALDIVCESAGLVAVNRNDGVIRVATRKTIEDEDLDRHTAERKREELLPLKTAVFQVKYANADELKTSVSFILSQRGSAQVDPRTNSILVTDIPDRVQQIGDMIAELDTETLQVEIVAKLVDVDVTTARELGIVWNLDGLHSDDGRITGSISHDTPAVDATTSLKFGMVRHWGNIDAMLQAMEQSNKANIISNPSITTVNNRQARILVGKEVPLIVLDKSGNPITQLKKVGITLEVTPYINSENKVTMDLHPEVSDLSSQATVQGGIVFATSEADTRVMVNDGETAVIGGLMSTNDTNFEVGVPILRHIPIFGHFFKETEVRRDHRELLIFVTPRIVRGLASKG